MQTNQAIEQRKIIIWSESPWNQSGKKGKGLSISSAKYGRERLHVKFYSTSCRAGSQQSLKVQNSGQLEN